MKRFSFAGSAVIFLALLVGCTPGAYTTTPAVSQQASSSDYCHKKLKPIGPSDIIRPGRGNGDFIDYYGPCDGPSVQQQIQEQRRFEQFRFGREYMDEG